MALPRLGQYQLALQHPATAFSDPELKKGAVETTPMGLPRVISGGFALTYHVKAGAREWAVRCFHREASALQQRYQAISRTIATMPRSGPFVPAEYLTRGVLVEGQWYPITKMPWLQAAPINRYIEANPSKPAMERLAEEFKVLIDRLAGHGIAHGDLQHGNILVDATGHLKLVDYDGVFVPTLRGLPANESGHVNYQHPQRAGQFNDELDRFSALVIFTALKALAIEPALWARYSNGENLLFKRADLDDPSSSPLFAELLALPEMKVAAGRLAEVCRADYATIPTLNEFLSGTFQSTPRRTTKAAPARRQFDLIAATDLAALVQREGDVVTVVGQVTGARERWSEFGRPHVVVSFGEYQKGCFTLVIWSQALNLFAQVGQSIEAYKGQWVSVTGLIQVYDRRAGHQHDRPQMVVNMPSEIQVLGEEQARALLAPRKRTPKPRAKTVATKPAPPEPAPAQPARSRSTVIVLRASSASALNRLYGGPPVPELTEAPTPPKRTRAKAGTATRKPRASKKASANGTAANLPPIQEIFATLKRLGASLVWLAPVIALLTAAVALNVRAGSADHAAPPPAQHTVSEAAPELPSPSPAGP